VNARSERPGQQPLKVIVEADGGSRGNPGIAGYGAVVRDAESGQPLVERFAALGIATNNVAEYSGLIAGLTAAAELGAAEVEVRMDSKLVVEQMAGRWKIKHPGLRPLAAAAAALAKDFDSVRFTWIPRESNRHADALANAAMDGKAEAPEAPGVAVVPAVVAEAGTSVSTAFGSSSWHPPAATSALRLVLVRHGATVLTAERRYSGRGDAPLSSQGLAQARAAAARIAGFDGSVSAVLTSPLRRCVATAEAIAAATGAPLLVEPALVECDFGAWEGLTFAEARERYAAEHAAWLGSAAVAPPGGESFRDVGDRVRRFIVRLRDARQAGTVIAVSHVSPIKLILQDALAARDAFLHRCYLSPAGISVLDSYPDGGVAVRTVNDTAHLSAELLPGG
jgi:ribonuclease H / adenosylcobalamin/alpha-ribazole phosphatase